MQLITFVCTNLVKLVKTVCSLCFNGQMSAICDVRLFYATVGRGIESFAVDRITELGGRVLKQFTGKVLFELRDDSINSKVLLNLKGVERVFCLISYKDNDGWSLSKLLQAIRAEIGQKDFWLRAFNQWQHFNPPTTLGLDEPLPKIQKLREESVTFRVNCKCSGRLKHRLKSEQLCSEVGHRLRTLLNWQIELRRPMLEVCIHINDEHLLIGVPVSRDPLSKRSYHMLPGLRATTCDLMVHLAQLEPGHIVLDPMCGRGTLLVEASVQFPDLTIFGCDSIELCVSAAQRNLDFAMLNSKQQQRPAVLMVANAIYSFLRRSSIDRVISDIPFGQQHSSIEEVYALLPKFISSLHRVLVEDGRAVILCGTQSVRSIVEGSQNLFTVISLSDLSLGTTSGTVLVLSKLSNIDSNSCDG